MTKKPNSMRRDSTVRRESHDDGFADFIEILSVDVSKC